MGFNKDIYTVDLMLGIPEKEDRSDWYTFMEPLLRDEESKSMFKMPAQYMFKDIPETGRVVFGATIDLYDLTNDQSITYKIVCLLYTSPSPRD